MLGPFDWYTVIEIGIAAGVVEVLMLIAWLTGQIQPPRRLLRAALRGAGLGRAMCP